jgi:hypothetical protein
VLGNVVNEDDGIEGSEFHDDLGKTVTSLTNDFPRSSIQMVSIAAVPNGPFNSPPTVYLRPNPVSSTDTTFSVAAIRRISAMNSVTDASVNPRAAKKRALWRPTGCFAESR